MTGYSGRVIDTHHHIWLRKDVAWLKDPPIPRMFGDYFGIRRLTARHWPRSTP